MRLRNIPGAHDYLNSHPLVIKNETRYRGTWAETFEHPENPIHIEIGMGKGKFLLTLAKQNPNINYIGIERYSSVLLRALEQFDNNEEYQNLSNVRFICMDAGNLPEVFAVGEVGKIYLNFSDPWPKKKHAKRRLTFIKFLKEYYRLLKDDGELIFKSDNDGLYEFSLEEIKLSKFNLIDYTFDYIFDDKCDAMSEYEKKFREKGQKIHRFVLKK